MALPKYKIKAISTKEEERFLRQWHYSKKRVPNSAIKLGCFVGSELYGVATFGKIINCVEIFKNTSNREGLELNRLAMVDKAPKNSESWFLMKCIFFLRKKYTWLKFINTWADGLRCSGGTIYKACGFHFLRKQKIRDLFKLPSGEVMHIIAFNKVYLRKYWPTLKSLNRLERFERVFGKPVEELKGGYQYHYCYLIDKSLESDFRLTPRPYEQNMRQ